MIMKKLSIIQFVVIGFCLLLIITLTLSLIISIFSLKEYKEDFEYMFGEKGYYICEVEKTPELEREYDRIALFCEPKTYHEDEFGKLEKYLYDLGGYKHREEEREGACWFFYNENGDKVTALRLANNKYFEWELLFEKSK